MTSPGTAAAPDGPTAGRRVLLLVPARTYRAADFLLAAARMGLDLVIGSDGALPVGGRPVIPVRPADPDASARRILACAGPVDAVVAADTPMLMLAAAVAAQMGLPHNPPGAVRDATDKARQRQRWAAAGVAQPAFRIVPAPATEDTIRRAAAAVGFPCMVKAVSLSASQGVLRAGDPAAAVTAARRIRHILAGAGHRDTQPRGPCVAPHMAIRPWRGRPRTMRRMAGRNNPGPGRPCLAPGSVDQPGAASSAAARLAGLRLLSVGDSSRALTVAVRISSLGAYLPSQGEGVRGRRRFAQPGQRLRGGST
jgi:hypothetical protein